MTLHMLVNQKTTAPADAAVSSMNERFLNDGPSSSPAKNQGGQFSMISRSYSVLDNVAQREAAY